jgi:catechol-2,3-dioxygenase
MAITGLNHAVLYVRDARRSAVFYQEVLGFRLVIEDPRGRFAFLRAPESTNHHDIAFFTLGGAAGPSEAGRRTVGMYHIAWAVKDLDELDEARTRLEQAGALVGSSDHGVNKSLYAVDPDGLEFEVTWVVPPDLWGDEEHEAIIRPLDIAADKRRYAGIAEG